MTDGALENEVVILRANVATLEQLLATHEQTASEAAIRLEQALAEVAARNESLERAERERSDLVTRLRMAVDELSTPVLEVWEDVLAIPIIGVVDSRRAADIMSRVLEETVRKQCGFVILDVTGVDVIDSTTAEHFTKLVRAVELIGARCVLTGVRPAVGQTLIDLGLDFGNVRTLRTLKHALRETIRLSRAARAADSIHYTRSNGADDK
jgi:rsbT co-antagonist protein RsbR